MGIDRARNRVGGGRSLRRVTRAGMVGVVVGVVVVGVVAGVIGGLASCAAHPESNEGRPGQNRGQNSDQNQGQNRDQNQGQVDLDRARRFASLRALHNVHEVSGSGGRLISGSSPDDDAAFEELTRLGIRTILSVDGSRPNADLARARGLRYVHIPVGYHGITREQQLTLAKAVRDLPGPVYIHCHHGKHRGPAAGALAAVSLGWITPAQGEAFMREAGTAAAYTGLWACVDRAEPLSPAVLDDAPAEFPEVAPVPGFTQAMVELDQVFSHLQAIDAAGWTTPRDHPDLVPAAEAGRLVDLFRACIEQGHAADRYEDFTTTMLRSLEVSQGLERAIVARGAADSMRAMLGELGASCKDCHAKHRDRRAW